MSQKLQIKVDFEYNQALQLANGSCAELLFHPQPGQLGVPLYVRVQYMPSFCSNWAVHCF